MDSSERCDGRRVRPRLRDSSSSRPALLAIGAGSQSFHQIVFNAVKVEVRTAILELIRRERENEMVDKKLIKEVVEVRVICPLRHNLPVHRPYPLLR